MLPIVHETFGVTSGYQLLSPVLSVIFILFYPLAMLLHVLGLGSVLDTSLLALFSLPKEGSQSLLPLWMMLVYAGVSLLAMKHKSMFYLTIALATLYFFYLFMFVK